MGVNLDDADSGVIGKLLDPLDEMPAVPIYQRAVDSAFALGVGDQTSELLRDY